MTLIEERPTAHAEHHYTRWAWIAVALTPILFVAGIIISLAASGAASPGLGGALVGLLSLAAPTAAVILAVAAMRAEQPAARTVLTASLIV